MAKSLFDTLMEEGFTPGEAGFFVKGLERTGKKANRSVEEQFYFFIKNMSDKKKVESYSSIGIEDIKKTAKELNFVEPNEIQLDEIVLRYPTAQEEDPTGAWFLVVESLLYEVMAEGYEYEYAVSTEEIMNIAKRMKKEDEINPAIIREVKNLYYQNDDIDKERKKGNILIGYIGAVLQYL